MGRQMCKCMQSRARHGSGMQRPVPSHAELHCRGSVIKPQWKERMNHCLNRGRGNMGGRKKTQAAKHKGRVRRVGKWKRHGSGAKVQGIGGEG